MKIADALTKFRDDMREWVINNLNARVPVSRTINTKPLTDDIVLSAGDVKADSAGSAEKAKSEAILAAADDATTKANKALSDSKTYTNQKIAAEVKNRDNAITAALAKAAEDAASKDDGMVEIAKKYTDEKISAEVANRNSAISTAKSEAVSSSNEYTDTKVSSEASLREEADDNVKKYALNISRANSSAALEEARSYTDRQIETLQSNIDTKISEETAAREEADDTVKKYALKIAQSNSSAALEEARKFTNEEIESLYTNGVDKLATARAIKIGVGSNTNKTAISQLFDGSQDINFDLANLGVYRVHSGSITVEQLVPNVGFDLLVDSGLGKGIVFGFVTSWAPATSWDSVLHFTTNIRHVDKFTYTDPSDGSVSMLSDAYILGIMPVGTVTQDYIINYVMFLAN